MAACGLYSPLTTFNYLELHFKLIKFNRSSFPLSAGERYIVR